MCPIKTFKIYQKKEEWVTSELLEYIKEKDELTMIAKRTGNTDDWRIAKYHQRQCKSFVRQAKLNFIQDKLEANSSDSKKFWKIINDILPNNKMNKTNISLVDTNTNNPIPKTETPNVINKFFAEIGPDLANFFNTKWYYEGITLPNLFSFDLINEEEIIKHTKELNIMKSSAVENVSTKVIKDSFLAIPGIIKHMYNQSITEGLFPDSWKRAIIIPLKKEGNSEDVNNLRPISLLPTPGKLLEKLIHTRTMKYLENQHILVDEQGGFQPNHSTILTTSYLTDYIFSAMNNNQITHTVFIDFKKAFDTINHKILLNKLKRLGFHQNAIKWFQNYLTNRTQRTFANKLISSELPIICGVPQGSILGPLMFLIYINDLTTCIKHSQCRLFADDTVLYVSCGSSSEAKVNLQADLDNLSQWCQKNQLTINTNKTKGMSFGNKRLLDRDLPLDLKLNGVSLMNVQNYKYLGIILDPNLSFAKHIANLVSVVNFKAYSFTKFRHMLTKSAAIRLYKSMILPYLDYGDSIYGGANQDLLQKLQRLQNRCLRIATYQFGHTDTTELHKQRI